MFYVWIWLAVELSGVEPHDKCLLDLTQWKLKPCTKWNQLIIWISAQRKKLSIIAVRVQDILKYSMQYYLIAICTFIDSIKRPSPTLLHFSLCLHVINSLLFHQYLVTFVVPQNPTDDPESWELNRKSNYKGIKTVALSDFKFPMINHLHFTRREVLFDMRGDDNILDCDTWTRSSLNPGQIFDG